MRARVRCRSVGWDRPGQRWHWVLSVTLVAAVSAWLAIVGGAELRLLTVIAGGDGVVPVLVVGLAVDYDADEAVDRLIEQMRRLRDGGDCDLDLPTDRDDDLGRLAAELDELATTLPAGGEQSDADGAAGVATDRGTEYGESRFEAVFNDPRMLVGLLDPDGTHRRSNKTAMSYIDVDHDAVAGVPFWETPWWNDHTETQSLIREKVERAASGEYASFEVDLTDASGDRFSREGTIRPVTEDGDVVSLVVSARDVTERKERERDLERYRGLVNAMRDSACICDAEGRFEVVNQALANFYRTTSEELEGIKNHLIEDIRAESDGDPYRALVEGRRGELRGEYEATYPGAGHAIVEYRMTRLTVDGEFDGVVAVARDVTDRKERERRFRAIVENTINPIYIKDRDGRYQFVNAAAAEVFGLEREEVVGKTDHELFEETSAAAAEDDQQILETGESVVAERNWRVDGEDVVFLDNKYPYRDDEGEVVGVIGISRQVTERRKKQQELERYKRFTDDILDAVDDVFYVLDESGRVQRWNDSLPAVTGYSDEEIAGMYGTDFFAGGDQADIAAAISAVFESDSVRVEVPFLTEDGESLPHEFVAARVETPEGEPAIAGIGRDISERRERERELERTKALLEQAQRVAQVGGWEIELEGGEPSEMTWTDQLYDIFEFSKTDSATVNRALERTHPEDREAVQAAMATAITDGTGFDMEMRIRTTGGRTRWVRSIGHAVRVDGETTRLRGSLQDITDRKQRELALESLHNAARELIGTESAPDVCDLVVDVATEVVDTAAVGIYLLDSERNTLDPTAYTDAFADHADGPSSVSVGDPESLVWHTYVTETRTVVEDGDTDGTQSFGDGIRNGVLVPIGDHGVFVALSTDGGIDATTRQLVETLVATTEAALDRLTSEATLRERDAELEAQNERLRRQIQITEIIRSIDQSLVGASTHGEIERTVCERLVEDETISFAWIGTLDTNGESVSAREWAGDGGSYLDAISADGTADTPEPAWRAARTESPVIVENVIDDLQREGWPKAALAQGFQSVVAVPLVFDEYSYGVLAVYANSPGGFGDLERSVFAELGESIANSITAAKTRQALHAETLLELDLRFEDTDDLLSRVASEADCRVEYEGLATVTDDDDRVFFVARNTDPGAVHDVLDGLVSVIDTRLVSDADGYLFEVTTTAPLVATKLVNHGGRPQSITADPTGMDVVVDLPTGTDVRGIVEMLREDDPSVELSAQRHVERRTQTRRELVTTLFETLTDRQREVLETAYLAGFFEQPRETTGEELAAMLGVSQPTVNRHLRLAQQRLMEQLFSTDAGGTE